MRNSLFWRGKVRRGRSEKQAKKKKEFVNTKLLLLSVTVNPTCTLVHLRKKIEAGRNNSRLSFLWIIFSFIIYHVFSNYLFFFFFFQIIYCKHVLIL